MCIEAVNLDYSLNASILDIIAFSFSKKGKQAEAEVVPSSSSVKVKLS